MEPGTIPCAKLPKTSAVVTQKLMSVRKSSECEASNNSICRKMRGKGRTGQGSETPDCFLEKKFSKPRFYGNQKLFQCTPIDICLKITSESSASTATRGNPIANWFLSSLQITMSRKWSLRTRYEWLETSNVNWFRRTAQSVKKGLVKPKMIWVSQQNWYQLWKKRIKSFDCD